MSTISRTTTEPVHTASFADLHSDPLVDSLDIPEDRLSVSTDRARTLSVVLFRRLNELTEGTAEYSYVRNTLVELNLSLVKYAAHRFRNRSDPPEDVVQVGTIGLIKAINRYDPERGVEFATFALPTITGEIKRFFRDSTWSVKVPRRLQELRLDIAKAHDAMEQRLGRRPTDHELAQRLGITEDALADGHRAANGYSAGSLDIPAGDDGEQTPLARSLGVEETAYDKIECLESLKPLLGGLCERDRLIISLRFGEELTQKEIGARLGISQMHVSRLLARIMTTLRAGLLAEGAPPQDAEEDSGDHAPQDAPDDALAPAEVTAP